ncbi:50S ribosomal protein L19e [Candidatus Woesearchaeota archaeon]|nr:50S ribosomal protein L19e [Candidatus Woesearchaeota archaeon]
MDLSLQKKLASKVLKCSKRRIKIDFDRMAKLGVETDNVKGAITKQDVRGLIHDSIIVKAQAIGISRARAKKRQVQKRKGRRQGHGSRKGASNARNSSKRSWIQTIRLQRSLLKRLKEKKLITVAQFNDFYAKAKGGFFRSKGHLKLYLEEHNVLKK